MYNLIEIVDGVDNRTYLREHKYILNTGILRTSYARHKNKVQQL